VAIKYFHGASCACGVCNRRKAEKAAEGSAIYAKDPEGVRKDAGKAPMGLIPPEAEEAEAHVWGAGAGKYGQFNWRKGMSLTRIIGCIQRHLAAIKRGEDYDKETGQPHAAHIRANAAMLIAFLGREDLDDRYKGE
jgi:hypothetical protein